MRGRNSDGQPQMMHHWDNLKYLWIHKWYVWVYGRRLKVSRLQLLLHDWTKLLPAEWFSDARHHYRKDLAKTGDFIRGRLHHIHWNKHHWQYWVILNEEDEKPRLVKIPERYIREMVADWQAAGRAKGETHTALEWYMQRKNFIKMHGESRKILEKLLYGTH
jgi:Family of unknown function (DUF5662)